MASQVDGWKLWDNSQPQGKNASASRVTGACMTPDGKTMFVNMQHPGETGAIGTDPEKPSKLSNWPDFKPDGRPRFGTVVMRRSDGR